MSFFLVGLKIYKYLFRIILIDYIIKRLIILRESCASYLYKVDDYIYYY